jgi:MFS family permease
LSTSLGRQLRLVRTAGSFRLLFLATLGSGVGTWMATVALTVDVFDRTHSASWVSALLVVNFLPSVVVGLAAGPLIDRLSRKRLVVCADLARLAVFAALPFVGSATAIVVLAAVAGFANSIFRPAVLAGMPNLVKADDLAHGTSLLQAVEWVATAFGPVLGGALVSASGPHLVYWINAVTFLVSALLLARIPPGLLQSEQGVTRGHWQDIGDGLVAVARSRALVTVLIGFGFVMLASGLINVAEIVLAKVSLHSGAFGFGLLWSASGIGLVIGSLSTGALVERRGLASLYPLAFLPWAAGIAVAAAAPNVWVAAAAMIVSGFGNGLVFPMTVLLVQQGTSDRIRGRAFTVIISAHNALLAVAMIAAGPLTDVVGARWTWALSAALIAVGGLVAALLLRGLDVEPAVAQKQAA